MPATEKCNAQKHEKLFRQPSSCVEKQQQERLSANQDMLSATRQEPAVNCTSLRGGSAVPQPMTRQGSWGNPGHTAALDVLSLPAQMLINAAT